VVNISRELAWDGFFNTRDLGGLSTRSGGVTRFGAFIRSADLRFVTDDGWHMAREAGVRTIIDLRNADEIRPAYERFTQLSGTAQFMAPAAGPTTPPDISRVEMPMDDIDDVEFWQHVNRDQLNGTPLYYRPFLEGKAERCAAVVHALACAAPGAVLFHCGAGRDRTGLVALLVLALADVEPSAIVEDYEMSLTALPALLARLGIDSQGPSITSILASRGTSVQDALLDILEAFNIEDHLSSAGASRIDMELVRDRLLGGGTRRSS
jgi:protein-tyrosine phosphatase